MREIKFRAWDKETKNLVYSEPLLGAFFEESEGRDVDLMQFTGLIFENGDLLNDSSI